MVSRFLEKVFFSLSLFCWLLVAVNSTGTSSNLVPPTAIQINTNKQPELLAKRLTALQEKHWEELNTKGYTKLRILSQAEIERLHATIDEKDQVDYRIWTDYVDKDVMRMVSDATGSKHPEWTKYRFSTKGGNATDAPALHKDVWPINEKVEYYTVCIYLDEAKLAVREGTHLNNKPMSLWDAATQYNNQQTIHMEPGTVLLFNAGLRHGGIFEASARPDGDRRLLQVFEITLDPTIGKELRENTRTFFRQANGTSNWIRTVSLIPGMSTLIRFAGDVAFNVGYHSWRATIEGAGLGNYIQTYEHTPTVNPNRGDPIGIDKSNMHVMNPKIQTQKWDIDKLSENLMTFVLFWNTLDWIAFFAFVSFGCFIIYHGIKRLLPNYFREIKKEIKEAEENSKQQENQNFENNYVTFGYIAFIYQMMFANIGEKNQIALAITCGMLLSKYLSKRIILTFGVFVFLLFAFSYLLQKFRLV